MSKEFRRRNHYIPRFYLDHWAQDGNICVYNTLVSCEVDVFRLKNPRGIACIEHLYTDLQMLQETDEFERWISSEIEEPYIRTQNRIFAEKRLNSDDYENLLRYAMAQSLRVPHYYFARFLPLAPRLENVVQKTGEKVIASFERRIKFGQPLPESKKLTIDGDSPTLKSATFSDGDQAHVSVKGLLGRKEWLFQIKRIVSMAPTKKQLHRWQIIRSLNGDSWFTSDNPVTLLNYQSNQNYNFNGGWGQKNTNIFMPISPQYLLFTQVGSKKIIENNKSFQNLINKMIIENSFLQVYSTAPNTDIPEIRPRIVDEQEYKRIHNMLSSWHIMQTEGEHAFFGNSNPDL